MFGRLWILAAVWCGGVYCSEAFAQLNSDRVPAEIAAVQEIDRRMDEQVPLQASFVDDKGHRVSLGDYIGERPIVLSLNYSDCPMLCQAQLRDFVGKFSAAGLEPLNDFVLVSISIDPNESVERAAATKEKYVALSGKPGLSDGWHFLTGTKAEIDRVAKAVGISYVYVPSRKEYSHPAVFVVLTPDGRISQYLMATAFDEETLRLTLVEASEGRIGTASDWLALACFVYDPNSNSYVFAARRVMQWGAGATVVMLVIGLVPFWMSRGTKNHQNRASIPAGSDEQVVVTPSQMRGDGVLDTETGE